jgi:hypothetical protein
VSVALWVVAAGQVLALVGLLDRLLAAGRTVAGR